jgi:hypothetical protein
MGRRTTMSERPGDRTSPPEDEASQGFGNLSVEDDANGTVDPADLARSSDPDDDDAAVES